MKTSMRFSITADINAEHLFEDEGVNWQYCKEHATFSHKEACEFIVHLFNCGDDDDEEDFNILVAEMRACGCTNEFVDACTEARHMGAQRALFWA